MQRNEGNTGRSRGGDARKQRAAVRREHKRTRGYQSIRAVEGGAQESDRRSRHNGARDQRALASSCGKLPTFLAPQSDGPCPETTATHTCVP